MNARAQMGGHEQDEDQRREAEEGIGNAHQGRVDPAADKTGQQAKGDTDHGRHHGADERHRQRHAGTVDEARDQVAPDVVSAKPVLC